MDLSKYVGKHLDVLSDAERAEFKALSLEELYMVANLTNPGSEAYQELSRMIVAANHPRPTS